MSVKRLFPFIAILVLLGVLVFLRQRDDAPASIVEQAGLESLVPEGISADDLLKVEMYASAKPEEKVVLEKDGDTWKIASSYGAPADAEVVATYLDTIANLQGERRDEATNDAGLAKYDLGDASSFRLVAYDEADGDPAIDLVIGKAVGSGAFLRRVGENTVYTEAANPRQAAGVSGEDMDTAPTPGKWLKKELIAYSKDELTKVAVEMPGKAVTFEKVEKPIVTPEPAEDGEEAAPTPPPAPEFEWKVASGGLGGEVKQAALDNILLKVSTLRVTAVADPAKAAEWGLETPVYRATATKSDGTEVQIEGGRPDPNGNGYVRIASDESDLIYEMASYEFTQLWPKGKDLFTLPEWTFTAEEADRVVIDQPAGRVVLSKVGDDWTVTRPSLGLEPQTTAITTLVSSLASWKPEDYADPDTDPGEFARSISVSAGGKTYGVRVGGDAEGIDGAYASIEGEDTILAMRRGDIEKMFLAPRDLYKLKLMDLTESQVNEIEVRQGETVITLARQGAGWKMATTTSPDAPLALSDADTNAADDLAYTLTELQASDIELGGGADVESLFAGLTVKGAEGQVYTLRIGPKLNGEHTLNFNSQGAILNLEADAVTGILNKVAALSKPAEETEAAVEAAADTAAAEETETAESTEETVETEAEAVDAPIRVPIPSPVQP